MRVQLLAPPPFSCVCLIMKRIPKIGDYILEEIDGVMVKFGPIAWFSPRFKAAIVADDYWAPLEDITWLETKDLWVLDNDVQPRNLQNLNALIGIELTEEQREFEDSVSRDIQNSIMFVNSRM